MSQKYIVMCLLVVILGFFNNVQISERVFQEKYKMNTTRVDIYDDNTAYIFLNNRTSAKHYLNLGNNSEEMMNGDYDILYKKSYFKKAVDNLLIILFMAMLMIKRGGIGGNIRDFIGTNNKKNKVTLADVAGLEDIKKEVFEFVDFLKNREKYLKVGARMPRGALLYGPPGTGKTLMAKAIAGETGAEFIYVSGADFSELYVGVGSSRVRDLFKKAREKAPCVIFIDEIDALGRARGCKISHHDKDNTLNRLLVEMDGFEPNDNVLIFGATNRADILDKALLRPGRFDRKIMFSLPEKREREKIYTHYLNGMKLSMDVGEIVETLSKQSCGFSGADISNMCNEACILSVRNKSDIVTRDILQAALDNIMLGPEKKTFRLSEEERKIVAYHESGHTVVAHLCDGASKPIKVSIMPRGKSALGFSQMEKKDKKLSNKKEIYDRICVLLGGRAAEDLFCEEITTGACDDLEKSTELAYKYESIFGTFHFQKEKEEYSEKLRQSMDQAVQKLIKGAYNRTKQMLRGNSILVHKLYKKLLEKETLNEVDLDIIFN
jgi:AFG3 family protein